ncbi:peroxisome biogenesis protein 3-2-like [Nymphaea colorata]|nr:peroxisome biogenesis protein 3-2-like [Nymphaea colorata]XP_031476862.1 peroxisome biogenesis protein 3-2-like [Nymphaea colorata]
MLPLRDFWRKHKRKVYVSIGILGSGYVLYKLYDSQRERIAALERELEKQHEADERIKAQMQASFASIQWISDTTTLPSVMNDLRIRMSEELHLSELRDRLNQGRSQPNRLTAREKLELWERLKILSFTKAMTSLWAVNMLTLFVRVIYNVLGRHLYIDTARGVGSIEQLSEADSLDSLGHHEFLSSADYLWKYSLGALILDMQKAITEVLNGRQLTELFSMPQLHDTIMEMLDTMRKENASSYHWVPYLLPDNASTDDPSSATSSHADSGPTTKLELLIMETRSVLSSDEFSKVVDISLREMVNGLMEQMEMQVYANASAASSSSGVPLVKLVPRIIELCNHLLEEPSKNTFIHRIQSLPELDVFCKVLFAGAPLVA